MGVDTQSWDTSSDQHIFRSPDGVNPAAIMLYNAEEGITHLTDLDGKPDKTTIVIATNGGYKDERPGQTGTIASYGVYFGPNSPYNQGALLPLSENQKSESAEYYAARLAIEFMHNHMWSEGHCIHVNKIVILTDSKSMVTGLTEVIKPWKEKGCHKKLKKLIASFDILLNIDRMMTELCHQGRIIKFWNVLRCHNTKADRLATQGFTQRGSSPFEHTVDRPWKEWILAKTLYKTQEERARSEAVIKRITFPLAPQDNKWTASITSFLIGRWVLNKEYHKEHPLMMMGNIFGPKYRDVFIQEQINIGTRMGELRHEITELSNNRQHIVQRHQIAELELRLEICQQILKKLGKHITSIPKGTQPMNLPEQTQVKLLPEGKQPEILSRKKQRRRISKQKQLKPALKTTQPNPLVQETQTIPLLVSTQPDTALEQLTRTQRKKRNRRGRKEAMIADKRSGKHTKK